MGKLAEGYEVDGAWQCVVGLLLMGIGARVRLPEAATAALFAAGIALAAVGVRKTWGVSAAWKAGDIAVILIAAICCGEALGAS